MFRIPSRTRNSFHCLRCQRACESTWDGGCWCRGQAVPASAPEWDHEGSVPSAFRWSSMRGERAVLPSPSFGQKLHRLVIRSMIPLSFLGVDHRSPRQGKPHVQAEHALRPKPSQPMKAFSAASLCLKIPFFRRRDGHKITSRHPSRRPHTIKVHLHTRSASGRSAWRRRGCAGVRFGGHVGDQIDLAVRSYRSD